MNRSPAPGPEVPAALARLYDVDLADDPGDVDLYIALALRTGGPTLELGAGTGRIAVPLAAAGYEVTAVDLDPAMLARARRRAHEAGGDLEARVHLVEADMRDLRLPRARFRLAFIALNSLPLLGDRDGQAEAVATLARHLVPGGLAVVDVWLPDAATLAGYDGSLSLEYVRRDPESGRTVAKVAAAHHDAATGTVELTAIYDEGVPGGPVARWIRQDTLRLVSPDELVAMARAAGLEVEIVAGGYDLEPLGAGAQRAVLVAVKRARRRTSGLV